MEKKSRFINGHNFFFWNFRETTRHFSLRSQNSEYPRIFQVTGANQNARKLLSTSTDLVNTKGCYFESWTGKVKKPFIDRGCYTVAFYKNATYKYNQWVASLFGKQ